MEEGQRYITEDEEIARRPFEPSNMPVGSMEQLGQDILRTFARVSDPNVVEYKKVRRRVPIFSTKTVLDKNGNERTVEYIERWDMQEWELPIVVQPKYHELISDDISRAFLSDGDLEVYRSTASYCKMVKSFSERYELDLSLHYNNFADENHLLVVSSGAYKGKRVQLAKTSIAETSMRQSSFQTIGQEKKKKGFVGSILNP